MPKKINMKDLNSLDLDDLKAAIEEADKMSLLSKELEERLSFESVEGIQVYAVINNNSFNMDLLKIKKTKNRYKLKALCSSNIVEHMLVYPIEEVYIKSSGRIVRKFNNKLSFSRICIEKDNNYLVNITIEREENEFWIW